ncbi:hypothetical protein Ahy_A05g021959 [Arachis hypogaea]|uniref:KIB1-4 beta-propeller domain-containing protein n=1 Tax=Arachis hypogaea TaxID=3818 RepID=A0A445CZD4_ARAHY|nr:hypothetical protein Ahy_A05g021959 [Arachis hypogaea]
MDEINRWADIDKDLLKEISKRFHAYDDYLQLRLVCKEWSLKLPKIPNGNKIPWLLLPDETVKNHSYEDEEIYHLMQLAAADDETLDTCVLEEKDIYHIMLPEMQSDNKFIRGSEFPTRDKRFEDVIFFQEKIYAINNDGQLYEFDTKIRAGLKGGIHETRPPSEIPVGPHEPKCLIGCANGSLLMLVRYLRHPFLRRIRRDFETYKFDIYELKRNRKEWSTLDNLGNYILVIGFNSSVQIPVPFLSKGNQIWFTDNQTAMQSSFYDPVFQDIGIFDLDHGNFQRVLLEVKFFCPPVWLLP